MNARETAPDVPMLAGQFDLQLLEVAAPTTVHSLWHGPFGQLLGSLLAFGDRAECILDDVDNAGSLWDREASDFGVIRRMVLKKRQWSNCRPLYGWFPDGLFYPNLGRANFQNLDKIRPLSLFAQKKGQNVSEFIRSSSTNYGCWCLYGPDLAIVGVPFNRIASAYGDLMQKGRDALRRSIVDPDDLIWAHKRFDHIISPPSNCATLNDISRTILYRFAAEYLRQPIKVHSLFHDILGPGRPRLFTRFKDSDAGVITAYNLAAGLQGSRPLCNGETPYYMVDSGSGEREFSSSFHAITTSQKIVPKILVLEGIKDQAFPASLVGSRSILAREICADRLDTGGTQIFYESSWIEALASCPIRVHVPHAFQHMIGESQLPLGALSKEMLSLEIRSKQLLLEAGSNGKTSDIGLDEIWDAWVVCETMRDLRFSMYPVLFLAVTGHEWVENIAPTRCFRYVRS